MRVAAGAIAQNTCWYLAVRITDTWRKSVPLVIDWLRVALYDNHSPVRSH
jgi:hypothetical protein